MAPPAAPLHVAPTRLFHFCRALCEYLHSRGDRAALVTDADTVRQKRNRAFAAELLAPAAALRARVGTSIVTWDQTEEIAEEFGVSAFVIDHQLTNHRIAAVERAHRGEVA
jgi:Zn-dependent peptidase ImmA (M78 family)